MLVAARTRYGTLDDVPDFALSNMEQLAKLTFMRFSHYHGVAFYGPTTLLSSDSTTWGRALVLPSGESLLMRFTPLSIMELPETTTSAKTKTKSGGEDDDGGEGHVGGGDDEARIHEPEIVCFATRIIHPQKTRRGLFGCRDHVAILYRPDVAARLAPFSAADIQSPGEHAKKVGARGLHTIAPGIFRRHDPMHHTPQSATAAKRSGSTHDRFHCEVLPASTYTTLEKDASVSRKHRRASPQARALATTAMLASDEGRAVVGPNAFAIVGELLDVRCERTTGDARMACEPISNRCFQETFNSNFRFLFEHAGDEAAAFGAMSSGQMILDLLSPEAVLMMRGHGFFKDALPNYLTSPDGLSLMLAVAVRLATHHWKDLRLPSPTAADREANDQFRMMWLTAGHGPPPGDEYKSLCAIDLVFASAAQCVSHPSSVAQARIIAEDENIKSDTHDMRVRSQLVFWQRVGQRLVTLHFGDGALARRMRVDLREGAVAHPPARFADSLGMVRAVALAQMGGRDYSVDDAAAYASIVSEMLPTGARRTQLVKMMHDVEDWLRRGTVHGAPRAPHFCSSTASKHDTERLKGVLGSMCKADDPLTLRLLMDHLNVCALEGAVGSVRDMLMLGSSLHLQQDFGAYIVAPSQHMSCSECDCQTHVLSGVLFEHEQSYCTSCGARRCNDCSAACGKTIQRVAKESQQKVSALLQEAEAVAVAGFSFHVDDTGKRCRRCGAPPATLTLEMPPGGGSRMSVTMSPRKSTHS